MRDLIMESGTDLPLLSRKCKADALPHRRESPGSLFRMIYFSLDQTNPSKQRFCFEDLSVCPSTDLSPLSFLISHFQSTRYKREIHSLADRSLHLDFHLCSQTFGFTPRFRR